MHCTMLLLVTWDDGLMYLFMNLCIAYYLYFFYNVLNINNAVSTSNLGHNFLRLHTLLNLDI
jgi:hypothetical protein